MKQTLMFVLVFGSSYAFGQDYSPLERYNDSLLIYNTYQAQAEYLKNIKDTTNLASWHAREDADDKLTACAKSRLRNYNHETYTSTGQYDRSPIGSVLLYPSPAIRVLTGKNAPGEKDGNHYRIVVYDKQTRFLTRADGKKQPYILKLVFEQGVRLNDQTELQDPITYKKIE